MSGVVHRDDTRGYGETAYTRDPTRDSAYSGAVPSGTTRVHGEPSDFHPFQVPPTGTMQGDGRTSDDATPHRRSRARFTGHGATGFPRTTSAPIPETGRGTQTREPPNTMPMGLREAAMAGPRRQNI